MGTTGKKRRRKFLVESYAGYYALLFYVVISEGRDDDDQLVRLVKSDTKLYQKISADIRVRSFIQPSRMNRSICGSI